jgi:hypothetical protein
MESEMDLDFDMETNLDMDMDTDMETDFGFGNLDVRDLTSPLVTSPVTEQQKNDLETFYRGLDIVDLVWFKLLKKTVPGLCLFPIYASTEVSMEYDDDNDNDNNNFIDAYISFKNYTTHSQLSKDDMSRIFRECGQSISVMFVEVKYLNYLHSNVLVIDHIKKVIEHYEPHGKYTNWETAFDQDFQIVLEHQLNDIFKGMGYLYTKSRNVCHQKNFTNDKLIREIGYCNVYSGWFALYRCQNMNYSLKEFTRLIDKIQKDRGAEYIARYAKVVMNMIGEMAKKYGVSWDTLDDLNDYFKAFDLFELEMSVL